LSSRFDAVIQKFLQETPPTSSEPVRLDGLDGLDGPGGVDIPVAPREQAPPHQVAGPLACLTMPLDVFAKEGQPLEIRVSWWPATLWFVPDLRHAEALRSEGVDRERVWTAAELSMLLDGPSPTPASLQVVMVARREFGGEVVARYPVSPDE
jgi:hypothetical protein